MILRAAIGGFPLFARSPTTQLGVTGDAANITGAYTLDGVDHPGGFATAHPLEMGGGVYWQPLSVAETNGNIFAYRWSSTTSGVAIDPIFGATDLTFDGILASATATTVTFPGADSLDQAIPDAGQYAFTSLFISGGAGAGQTLLLATPAGNPREYNVVPTTMPTQCDGTSQYQLQGTTFSYGGTLGSATSTTVTFPSLDSLSVPIPDDGRYADSRLWIAAGAGAGQFVVLTTPTGTAREYNVLPGSMTTQVDSTSRYELFGGLVGRADMTQAVPTANDPQTMGDALNAARAQGFGRWTLVGQVLTLFAGDNVTPVRTFTLDAASAPSSPRTRN